MPGPCPWWTATRLWRFGRPKVDWPSPPYVVPISVKSVSFSAIGTSWPSQNAQPAGAKLPPNIRISPTYGEPMSVPAREDAREGDDPVQPQQRLAVLVRLAAADVRDGRGVQRRVEGPAV